MSKDTSQITEIEISGVDPMDYPDFSDAYICRAQYKGIEMTDEQLDELQDGYGTWCYETIFNHIVNNFFI